MNMTERTSLPYRRRAGMTLIEVVVSVGILSLVVFGMTGLMMNSSRSSDRTMIQNEVDSDVALAVEKVHAALAEARFVAIDADGMGLTYKKPPTNQDGTYSSSATAVESTTRSFYLSDGDLYCSDDANKPLLENVPSTDPETGEPLVIFGTGVNGKELTVRLVSSRITGSNETVYSAVTTRVRPRNM